MKFNYLTILIILVFTQCKNSKEANNKSESYKTAAIALLGESAACELNEKGDLALCTIQENTKNGGAQSVKIVVITTDSNEVKFEKTFDKSSVKWFSNTQISVFQVPGIMREDDSRDNYTSIYDIETGSKTKKTDLNKD